MTTELLDIKSLDSKSVNQLFAEIHAEIFKRSSTPADLNFHRKVLKYKVIPKLVEKYKKAHPTVSWSEAYLAIRDAHIEYIGTLFPPEGISTKPIPGATFESKQTPVWDKEGKFHCCYRRNKTGLPAYRELTLTVKGKELIRWYHHSSPIPYEIETDKQYSRQRLNIAIKNFEQLPSGKIAEIRLLSPMKGLKETFSAPFVKKYFTTLNDYDQLLETAIAAELSRKDILLFNLGVNYGRKHAASLQKKLNIRALKTLLSRIPYSGISLAPNSFSLSIDDPDIKHSFLSQLTQQNPEEYTDLPENIDNSSATPYQKKLYKKIMGLLRTGEWVNEENNYYVQAYFVLLLFSLGYYTVTGCNDAKDRDGQLTNIVEALLIFVHKSKDPLTEKLTHKDILSKVREHSTAQKVAEAISLPGFARGLDIDSNTERALSKIFKMLYTENHHKAFIARDEKEAKEKAAAAATAHVVTDGPIPLATVAPQQEDDNAEENTERNWFWHLFATIGTAVKKFARWVARGFWGLLITGGLVTAAVASPDISDGQVSISPVVNTSVVPLTGSASPPTPSQPLEERKYDPIVQPPSSSPAQKKEDSSPIDDITSDEDDDNLAEDEDGFYSRDTSPNTTPPFNKKTKPEEKDSVKAWKEIRDKTDSMTTVEKIQRMGLSKKISSTSVSNPLSSLVEEEHSRISRRTTV